MFEVICVRELNCSVSRPGAPFPKIEIGDIKTVAYVAFQNGHLWYCFVDIEPMHVYDVNCFAPCTGPDEVDLMEKRYDQEIARLDAEYENIAVMLNEPDNL